MRRSFVPISGIRNGIDMLQAKCFVVACVVASVGFVCLLRYAATSTTDFRKMLIPTEPTIDGEPARKNKIKRPTKRYNYEATMPPHPLTRGIRKDYKRRLPKVIGIGVKKCGTTALVRFMNLHPDIVLPKNPEAHFFDTDGRYNHGKDFYRKQMPYSEKHQITMEKSPRYFVLAKVPERVKRIDPNMKILLVVCDPVKRAYSDYNFQANTEMVRLKIKISQPPPSTFDEFVEMTLKEIDIKKKWVKIRGETYEDFILKSWSPLAYRRYLSYLHTGIYSVYLQNWLRYFPPEQIHIINGDELVTDPLKVINETEDFIGIERKVGEKNIFFDEEKGFYCMRRMEAVRCLDPSKGTTRNKKLDELMKPETFEKLRAYYKPYNKLLFDMTGKDFAWV